MFGKTISASLVAVTLFCAPALADEKPKSVDQLVAKYIDAIGGRKAVAAIKSVRLIGTTMIGGVEAPMRIEMARPNKIRTEIEFQGVKLVTGFDGVTGWMLSDGGVNSAAEKMTNEQMEAALAETDFDGPLIDYKKKGHKLELDGDGTIDGSPTYKLKLTRKSGKVEYFHLDKDYFLLVARTERVELDGGAIELAKHFGDYKAVSGKLFAHSVENRRGGMSQGLVTFQKIEVNSKISNDRFAMPGSSSGR